MSRALRRIDRMLSASSLGVLVAAGLAAPALANTVNGAPVSGQVITVSRDSTVPVPPVTVTINSASVLGPGSIGLTPTVTQAARTNAAAIAVRSSGETNINVHSGFWVGAHNSHSGIWVNNNNISSVPGIVSIVNDGNIQGDVNGINIASTGLSPDPFEIRSLSISGAGRVFGGQRAITAYSFSNATLDGMSLIMGRTHGVLLEVSVCCSLNSASSRIDVGQTTRLGTVVAGTGDGLSVINRYQFRMFIPPPPRVFYFEEASGDSLLRLSDITAGGTGVRIRGMRTDLSFNGTIMALQDGVFADSYRLAIDGEGAGRIVSGADGVSFLSQGRSIAFWSLPTGDLIVGNLESITASRHGIVMRNNMTGRQTASINGVRSIVAGGDGIQISTYGRIRIGDTVRLGDIRSGAVAVSINVSDGDVVRSGFFGREAPIIRLSNVVAGIGVRWFHSGTATVPDYLDAALIDLGGAMQTTGTGIYLYHYAGPITVTGTGTITAGSHGIHMFTGLWRNNTVLSVSNLASISAPNGIGILLDNYGTLSVSGVGSVTGGDVGIAGRGSLQLQGVGAVSGGVRGIDIRARDTFEAGTTVNIGTVTPNGTIIGGIDGIRAESKGAFNLTAAADITGTTGTGVLQTSDAAATIRINAGTVSGAVTGMNLTNTGNSTVFVAPGATVQGATGLTVTTAATGRTTVQINGTLQSTRAAGSGTDVAISSRGPTSIVAGGTLIGRIVHTAATLSPGESLSISLPGGTWIVGPGTSSFGGTADSVTNTGTIQFASGLTNWQSLESLTNSNGGLLSFWRSSDSTDTVRLAGLTLASGVLQIDFDADAALGVGDAGTAGNADTIWADSVARDTSAMLQVEIRARGGTNAAGSPVALTGSVAVIYAGVTLPAPLPGATLTPAAGVSIAGGNPSTASRTFALVGDGLGGVFLQWVPVTSGGTIGGFSGGALGAADSASGSGVGGSLGFLQASLAGASQAAVQVADMTSFGAAFGGTGAAGAGCGSADGAAFSVRTGEWAGTGRRSASGASAQGRDLAFSPGAGSDSCGRVSVGAFQFGGTATAGLQAQRGTDAARGTAQGAGGYVRADSGTGFFAQLTGAAGSQRARVRNGIFGTEATVDTTLGLVDITAGYATPISDGLAIETRLSATRLTSAANPFRDSLGYEVTRLDTRADSLTATAGLIARTDSGGQGFVRAGIRTTDARQDGLAYGIRTLSQDSGTGSVLEAGWNQPLGEEASVEFALSSDSGGPLERQEARVQFSFGW